MEEPGRNFLVSNAYHFAQFLESTVWRDMQTELDQWESDVREIMDSSIDTVEIYRCQGRLEAIRNFRAFPEVLGAYLESVEERADSAREEMENG